MIPKREMAASGLLLVFLFLLLGGLWVSLVAIIPDSTARAVVTCGLGVAFAGTFVWMLIRRVQGLFRDSAKMGREMALAVFNLALLLLAFSGIYARFGIVDTTSGGEVTHDFLDCLYYSIVTFTTLGYGDFQPQGIGRAMAAVQALTGYLILGMLASTSASLVQVAAEKREERAREAREHDEDAHAGHTEPARRGV